MYVLNLIKEIKWNFINKKLKSIKLIILDVDGVMTDGFLYYSPDGNQTKRFSVKDGLGIRYLQKAGLHISIISGGKGEVIKKRAEDLNITHVYYSVKDKKEKVKYVQRILNIKKEQTLYLGDDLNDLTVRDIVILLIAPQDASKGLKKHCDAILRSKGGNNAIRELAERLLKNTPLLKEIETKGFLELNN